MEVIWIAVIVAAIVKFVIGSVWYAPPVFGTRWQALAGITPEQFRANMVPAIVVQLIGDLIMAYVLARLVILYGGGIGPGVVMGAMVWLGFVATISIGQVFYENRPMALWTINNLYQLVGLAVMGLILGWWHAPTVIAVTPA